MKLTAHNGFRASGLQGFRASGLQGDGRDIVLDSLRGFAIILVVVGHVFKGFEDSGIITRGSFFSVTGYYFVYNFHMPLMFMISGYADGMRQRPSGTFRRIMKCAADIYLPGLYFSFLLWLPKFFMFHSLGLDNTENFSVATMSSLYYIPLRGFAVYWFLCSLFFVKSLHILLERFIGNRNIHALLWVIIFLAAGFYGNNLPAFLRRMHYGLYFHAGYIMSGQNIITRVRHPRISRAVMLFLAGILIFSVSYFCGIRNLFVEAASALCISTALLIVFYALNVRNSLLVLCGTYSMVIYIPHNSIIAVLRIMLRFLGLSSFTVPAIIVMSVFFFCAALFIPLCIVWLYKNVKRLGWIEYIFYPGKLIFRK